MPAEQEPEHGHGHGHGGHDPYQAQDSAGRSVRIGVGGPVGSGKTALVAALARSLAPRLNLAVVTNDIYTTEDADFLRRAGVLAADRIEAVQTGCCPHTAIRDDITANLDAVELLEQRFGDLDLVLVESGGDNLTAVFSRGLVDRQIFVVDVAGGDKVPRKGGPGVTSADLLVINKVDLAPLVGADMGVMVADAHRMRGKLPVIAQSLVTDPQAPAVTDWVLAQVAAVRGSPTPTGADAVAAVRRRVPTLGTSGGLRDDTAPAGTGAGSDVVARHATPARGDGAVG